MTLDPQAKDFLAFINRLPRSGFDIIGAEKARQVYDSRPVDWGPAFIELHRVDNVCIDLDTHQIPLRIYSPVKHKKPLPVLVFYHGGGMVIGTLDGYDTLCRQLAFQSECIVVSVDYRLAPENKFPAAVDDAFAALQWTADNIQRWHGDNNNIVVGGDSAGGSLAAVVALLVRDQSTLSLRGQLLIYPATAAHANFPSQLAYAEGYFLERATILWFHKSYIRSDSDRKDFRYAPLVADDHSHLPPAFILVAGYDPLRDEGIAYAKRLQECGVSVELVNYEGQFHPFVSLAGSLDAGKRAISECAQALKKLTVRPLHESYFALMRR